MFKIIISIEHFYEVRFIYYYQYYKRRDYKDYKRFEKVFKSIKRTVQMEFKRSDRINELRTVYIASNVLRAYPTQPYCLLSPTGPIGPSVVQGPTYRPPSLIHSSLDLLSSLHTPI